MEERISLVMAIPEVGGETAETGCFTMRVDEK